MVPPISGQNHSC